MVGRRGTITLGVLLASLIASACTFVDLEKEQAKATDLPQTSFLYAADGTFITELHAEQDRVLVPFDEIPESMRQAAIAVEDRRFYQHRGIDLKALLRAAYIDATEGRIVEGGSTISQQYVKNVYLSTEQTVERKLKEALLAWQLEQRYSKDQILNKYLNTVYFGSGAYGVEAAAKAFFSRSAQELTLSQSALLAGLINDPTDFNPLRHPNTATNRRNLVLEEMHDQGMITRAQSRQASKGKVRVNPPPEREDRTFAPYFVDHVYRWFLTDPLLKKNLGDPCPAGELAREACPERFAALFEGGLRITTTLDPKVQEYAEQAVGDVLTYRSDPYAALTSIDPRTGYIRAMVGGRDYYADRKDDPYAKVNLATGGSTGRQAGSAFKPFALVAALENGISPQTIYSAPGSIRIPLKDGQVWSVSNADLGSYGSLSLESATVNSVNTVYAQVIMDVGPEKVIEVAERMGIRCCRRSTQPNEDLQAVPAAVLGANSVNTLEMASAFGTLATGGYHVRPTPVLSVTDARGNVLWEAESDQKLVLDPPVATTAADILQKAVLYGTGEAANIGRPQIGKTGTAQLYRDAFFAGAIPQLVTSVWVGFPQGQISMQPPRTRITVFGGTWPAQIWRAFMVNVTRHVRGYTNERQFPIANVRYINVTVDFTQDCLPNEFTLPQNIDSVRYIAGTQPTKRCREPSSAQSVSVPSVVGLIQSEAEDRLTQAGFYVDVKLVPSTQAAGIVLAQTPSSGVEARQTSTVTITVSQASGG